MADIEANLITYLLAQAGIQTVFGNPARIYVDRIHPSVTVVYPFAIIRTVNESPEYAHDGALPDSGVYQIDVYDDSDSKAEVNTADAAIRAELSGYSGTMGTMTIGSSFIVNARGEFDPDAQVYRRSVDVQIAQDG